MPSSPLVERTLWVRTSRVTLLSFLRSGGEVGPASFHLSTWTFKTGAKSRLGEQKGNGGEGGIRTPDTLASMPHFECGAFNHSATSPQRGRPCRPGALDNGCLARTQGPKWADFGPFWRSRLAFALTHWKAAVMDGPHSAWGILRAACFLNPQTDKKTAEPPR